MKLAIAAVLFVMIFAPCAAQAVPDAASEQIIVYRLPDPERVYMYPGGFVVYEAKIPENTIVNNAFILPENIQPDSLVISRTGRRVYSYSTELVEALVVLRRGEHPVMVRILRVSIPELPAGVSLDVKYGIRNSGLTWTPVLDMEVEDGNYLGCALLADIRTERELSQTTRYILDRRPEIILASSQNTLLDDTGAVFNIGRPLIEANKRTLFTLEEGRTRYNVVYQWDANRDERLSAYLRAPSPFKTMVRQVRMYLNASGMNVGQSSGVTVSPDRPIVCYIGEQPNITAFKSVRTAEFPERENLPFTHYLEYRVTNQLERRVSVEISVPVSYGVRHRNLYHFTREPDERPGDRMLWKYDLGPGEEAVVEFNFDSETKDNPLYSQFNYNEGGR
ncbi:MAG: DUF4139 domain-containing protein [Spirochaetaceae bacterium]|jgi:hypothetical protein|nr:DUF4139 domain-containing protein [Spirochaetaceae bacterium]